MCAHARKFLRGPRWEEASETAWESEKRGSHLGSAVWGWIGLEVLLSLLGLSALYL